MGLGIPIRDFIYIPILHWLLYPQYMQGVQRWRSPGHKKTRTHENDVEGKQKKKMKINKFALLKQKHINSLVRTSCALSRHD